MSARHLFALLAIVWAAPLAAEEPLFKDDIDVKVPHISTDSSVRYDYDIVYVRAQRAGDDLHKRFYTDIATPVTLEPNADLMLLHPDGKEEVLVPGGESGAITDPSVSLDGQWVYYTHIYDLKSAGPWQPPKGADIFKIHLASRKIVRLTNQHFTPNTGAADWAYPPQKAVESKTHLSYGVLNMGAFPLPGKRIIYTSNRNAFAPSKGYPRIALQLFVMDDRDVSITGDDPGDNVEQIGHLNLAGALHPVTLADGRVIFSSLESQGIRNDILWGIWSINPDGSNWNPVMSAFDPGGAPNAFHFQTQLGDRSVVIEEYYNQNNSGFGALIKLAAESPDGYPMFSSAWMDDPRQKPLRYGRYDNGKGQWYRMPFMPVSAESLTPFSTGLEGPANSSVLKDKDSPKVGKFTHPSGAPDNHLLTIYSPGPVNHQYTYLPQLDGGIYLIKGGRTVESPSEMLLIKNDPQYNEQWARAVVPYERIYGIKEPKTLPRVANDGKQSTHLPEGTPFGLVGSSSLYKRESYPNGKVPPGAVTATYAGGNDPWKGLDAFTSHGNGMPLNWHNQGGDAGLYSNSDIHAIRILAMEPTTDRNRGPKSGRLFASHAHERLRILGELPVRKFAGDQQPLDPDGNPDTSFLAKLPADVAYTFQTIDRRGMVLNMSQTWHQVRPGEIRTNCGGCHAHSQKPTHFALTAAAKPEYPVWDLTKETPLVTPAPAESTEVQPKWDTAVATGLRREPHVKTIEYFRDIQPILARSCVACHTKDSDSPPGNLVLDADDELVDVENSRKLPGTYYRLAMDESAKFGHKPIAYDSWGYPNASRYIRKFQSRRSLLVWKIHGERLDGFSNDDHPSERTPGDKTLVQRGKEVPLEHNRSKYDLDFVGSRMPPEKAVKEGKVQPLSDEDRLTIVRWIDLGCPLDLDYDPLHPERRGYGYAADDNRPTLTLTSPQLGQTTPIDRILVGMHDYGTGLAMETFQVVASFPVNGIPAGKNLAPHLKPKSDGVWELVIDKPLAKVDNALLKVVVRDIQGNKSEIYRRLSIGK